MALLALELPDQGERAVPGQDYFDALDPGRLAVNIRQSVVDVTAVLHAAKGCGLVLPGGERFTPSEVRYAGYSLGSIVGSVARSEEPELGATVLFAPGGDLPGWMMLHVGVGIGSGFLTCIGGPQHGESCKDSRRCAPPGVCTSDPYFSRLGALLDPLYHLVTGPGDPLSVAGERRPPASRAPLLLITGGKDFVLQPALATRLADAYRMRPVAPHRRRGPRSTFVQWPGLGHNLMDVPAVREQAYTFLATRGRRVLPSASPSP
jgi:pimeloyl-ACP methyl ester carboxylesterase